MTTADDKIERLADRLQAFANRSASEGGAKLIYVGRLVFGKIHFQMFSDQAP